MIGDQEGDDVALHLLVVPDGGVPPDESTAAVVECRLDDGTVRAPTAYPDDETRSAWSAVLTAVGAGLWDVVWTVTGTGAGVTRYRLPVGPATSSPAGRVYATTTELADALDAAPPDNARLLLRRASAEVERWTRCAVYDVDDDGMPTDLDVRVALRDAVCAQVAWWAETGDDGTGAAAALAGASIGSVRLPSATSTAAATMTSPPGCAPACWAALSAAGLTGQGPTLPGRVVDVVRQGGHE